MTLRSWRRGLGPAAALLALLLAPASASAADATVLSGQGGDRFSPARVDITAGDTVTWRNVSGYHNVHGSGFQNTVSNDTWTFSHTFQTAGSYDYVCDVHPLMKGTVVVTAAAAPAPSPSPSPTATPTPTATATPTPTATASPTPTATASPTPTVTASPSPTGTATPSPTVSPTGEPTPEPTETSAADDPGDADEPVAEDATDDGAPGDDAEDDAPDEEAPDDGPDGGDGAEDDDASAGEDEPDAGPTPLTAAPATGSSGNGLVLTLLALGVLVAGGVTAVLIRQRRRAIGPR